MKNNFLLFALVFSTSFWANAEQKELQTVPNLDLDKYMKTWYEIARYPNKYQKGCINTKAVYTKEKNKIKVLNICTHKSGKTKKAEGVARKTKNGPGKLQVNFAPGWLRFFGIAWGDYWVIDLADNYEYAVVSGPKKNTLWILSETPQMEKKVFDKIVSRLVDKGFNKQSLIIAKDSIINKKVEK